MVRQLYPDDGRTKFSLLDLIPTEQFHTVGQYFSFKVTSWSMFPTIRKGDLVSIGPAVSLQSGDILVFQRAGEIICHRLVRFGAADDVYTKGDSEEGEGTPIRQTDILGKVQALNRKGKVCPTSQTSDPSISARLQRAMDLLMTRAGETIRSEIMQTFAILQSSHVLRKWMVPTLKAQLRFSLGFPAPLQSVRACRRMPLPCPVGADDWVAAVRTACEASKNVLLLAHFGPYWLGSIDVVSARVSLRPEVVDLGLEDLLHDLARKVRG
jgi:signal peptidase I